MKIKVTFEILSNGYTARADCDVGCFNAQGKTRAAALDNAVAYALENIAREINEGNLSAMQVFPLMISGV